MRLHRWVIRSSIAILLSMVALVGLGLPVYVFPPSASLDRADLVYVIGPPTPSRTALADSLLADGRADRELISVSPVGRWSAKGLGVECENGAACLTPSPFTTKGEASMLDEFLSRTHDADTTVVITITPHVARTRFIFAMCSDANVVVVGVDQDMTLADWAYQYVYQSAAFVKAFFTPCG